MSEAEAKNCLTNKINHINSWKYLRQKRTSSVIMKPNVRVLTYRSASTCEFYRFKKMFFFVLVSFGSAVINLGCLFNIQVESLSTEAIAATKNKCMTDFMHEVLLVLYCSSIFSLLHSHYQGGQSRSGNQIQPILLASYFWSIPEIRHKHTGTRSVWTFNTKRKKKKQAHSYYFLLVPRWILCCYSDSFQTDCTSVAL